MSSGRRVAEQLLGIESDTPRAVVDKQFRRRALRQKRLLAHEPDALRHLKELTDAYALVTHRKKHDPNGNVLVVLFAAFLVAGWLVGLTWSRFVFAPIVLSLAGFFWVVDVATRRLKRQKTAPPPSDLAALAEAEALLGSPLERPVDRLSIEPPETGAYLADAIVFDSPDKPAATVPAGTPVPFADMFVVEATGYEVSALTLPIHVGGRPLPRVRIHALRPLEPGHFIDVEIAVRANGLVELQATDSHSELALRVESESELIAPIAVALYRG